MNVPEPLNGQVERLAARLEETGAKLTAFALRPIPCNCRQDSKCKLQGKHPWTLWADMQAGEVRWREGATGLGVVTGQRSGVIVIDVDSLDALAGDALAHLGEPMPPTFTVASARGRHFYYRWPGRFVKSSAGEIAPKVDVRGDGGMVVAPGSLHKTGKHYEICDDRVIEHAPEWLLRHPASQETLPQAPAVSPVPVPEGPWLQCMIRESRRWLASLPPCRPGLYYRVHGADKYAFWVALVLMRERMLPIEVAMALLCEPGGWNDRAVDEQGRPWPWTAQELTHKLEDARDKGHW